MFLDEGKSLEVSLREGGELVPVDTLKLLELYRVETEFLGGPICPAIHLVFCPLIRVWRRGRERERGGREVGEGRERGGREVGEGREGGGRGEGERGEGERGEGGGRETILARDHFQALEPNRTRHPSTLVDATTTHPYLDQDQIHLLGFSLTPCPI